MARSYHGANHSSIGSMICTPCRDFYRMGNWVPMNSAEFYDEMADDFHLIATDWNGAVERQGALIEGLLQKSLGGGKFRVLDCSCGIGTQAFGLAKRGHSVVGTDISSGAIQKAQVEALKWNLDLSFSVADMRTLEGINGPFDAVISFDNSVAHLSTEADLAFAFSAVHHLLRPGGVFLLSLRDYDQLRKDRPSGTIPKRIVDSFGERVYVQTWDWAEDGRTYDISLFILKRSGREWAARPLETKLRAYTRAEIEAEIEKTGFASHEWRFPDSTGFYQPVLIARKA